MTDPTKEQLDAAIRISGSYECPIGTSAWLNYFDEYDESPLETLEQAAQLWRDHMEGVEKIKAAREGAYDQQKIDYEGGDFYDENEVIDPYFHEPLMQFFATAANIAAEWKKK